MRCAIGLGGIQAGDIGSLVSIDKGSKRFDVNFLSCLDFGAAVSLGLSVLDFLTTDVELVFPPPVLGSVLAVEICLF